MNEAVTACGATGTRWARSRRSGARAPGGRRIRAPCATTWRGWPGSSGWRAPTSTATSSRRCRFPAVPSRSCHPKRSTRGGAGADREEARRPGSGDRAGGEEARERELRREGARGRGRRGARKLAEYREALELQKGSDPILMNFAQAEEYLLSLELFGMRFGLDRMHRLMTVLGLPQRRFASIHVVGSNGKTSTVRFCAAILEREGCAPAATPRRTCARSGSGSRWGRSRSRRPTSRRRSPRGAGGGARRTARSSPTTT